LFQANLEGQKTISTSRVHKNRRVEERKIPLYQDNALAMLDTREALLKTLEM